jgi:hypothetical protein
VSEERVFTGPSKVKARLRKRKVSMEPAKNQPQTPNVDVKMGQYTDDLVSCFKKLMLLRPLDPLEDAVVSE